MNAFQEYFIDVFKYKYADFAGRATRSEYWYFILFYFAITLLILPISFMLPESLMMVSFGLLGIFILAIIIPSLALVVRRLHDTGKSGWWYLISFIPLGSIVLLVFFCLDSEPGTNKWGPNPKNPSLEGDVTDHLLEDEIV